MGTEADEPFTIVFVGYATESAADDAAAYEDSVLPLLAEFGARVVYRGRRVAGQDPALPAEVHLLWFPHRSAFDAYITDERRTALLAQFGEVFTAKHAVEMETIVG